MPIEPNEQQRAFEDKVADFQQSINDAERKGKTLFGRYHADTHEYYVEGVGWVDGDVYNEVLGK
jgi:hypothetical protein